MLANDSGSDSKSEWESSASSTSYSEQLADRCAELSFDDGNIVFVAEECTFRVHRGVLSRYSQVFRDMFSIPQPKTSEAEQLDGCPIMHVSESKQDMALLFTALYDIGSDLHDLNVPMQATDAEALLRVAKKYEIPAIRRSVIKRFEEQFPTKLEDFRSRQPSQRTALNISDLNIFTLIHTIREHDFSYLLPSAYHHASQLSYSQFVAALTQDRWTMSDMVPCLQMRQHLLILHGQLLEWFSLQSGGGIPFRDCEDYSSCRITELRNEIRISFGKTGHSINWSHDWLKNAALKYDWCKVCSSKLQERYDRQLQSAWDKLNTVEV